MSEMEDKKWKEKKSESGMSGGGGCLSIIYYGDRSLVRPLTER